MMPALFFRVKVHSLLFYKDLFMFKIKSFAVLTFFTFLAASPTMAETSAVDKPILAQVGSATLTSNHYAAMVELLPPQVQVMLQTNPEIKNELITRWVEINLLAQEAMATGLDQNPAVTIKIDEMKNRLLVEALINKRLDTTALISPEEIAAYYQENGKEFEQGEQVQAQHILIRSDTNTSEEDQAKAKEKINEIAEKLKNGTSFNTLVTEYSEDPTTKNNGGDLGYFSRGQMVTEFEDTAFATPPGTTSSPVQTRLGWHLIHVIDKKAPEKLPLEKVSQQIEATLQKENGEKQLQELLVELKKKYPVKILN